MILLVNFLKNVHDMGDISIDYTINEYEDISEVDKFDFEKYFNRKQSRDYKVLRYSYGHLFTTYNTDPHKLGRYYLFRMGEYKICVIPLSCSSRIIDDPNKVKFKESIKNYSITL